LLYVDDAAEGIMRAAERLDDVVPVNPGTGIETSIEELAHSVAELCGFRGRIVWDTSKPDGHPRRALDISRARCLLGFAPTTRLLDGLRETLDWWRRRRPGRSRGAQGSAS
jgi:GDP-L-fucose synthase